MGGYRLSPAVIRYLLSLAHSTAPPRCFMAFAAASSSSQTSEINVTPLIDVLLVLLIIFMVIVPVVPRGLDSSIPQGKASPRVALPPVVVSLLADGVGRPARYQIAHVDVAQAALPARLRSLFAARQDRTIFVEADRSLGYREVAEVVSDAHEAGAGAVVLSGLRH
jgi:biopolymer transport protein TolR